VISGRVTMKENTVLRVAGVQVLDPAKKRRPANLPTGYWSRPPPWIPRFPRLSATLFQLAEWTSRLSYSLSRSRRAAARARQPIADIRNAEANHVVDPHFVREYK
jgi:hypothetical protein